MAGRTGRATRRQRRHQLSRVGGFDRRSHRPRGQRGTGGGRHHGRDAGGRHRLAPGRKPGAEGGELEQELGDDDGSAVDLNALDDLGLVLRRKTFEESEQRLIGRRGVGVQQMHHDHRAGGPLQRREGPDPVLGNGLEQLVPGQEFVVGQLILMDSLV